MGVIGVHLRNASQPYESIISCPGIYAVENKSNERYIFVAFTTRLEYRRYFSHMRWHLLFVWHQVLMFSSLFCCRFDFNTVIAGKSILYNLHEFNSKWFIVLFILVRKYHRNQLRWNKHNCCVNNRVSLSWHSSPLIRCFSSGPLVWHMAALNLNLHWKRGAWFQVSWPTGWPIEPRFRLSRFKNLLLWFGIFSCDQAALRMAISVCPSVRLWHLFHNVPLIVSS